MSKPAEAQVAQASQATAEAAGMPSIANGKLGAADDLTTSSRVGWQAVVPIFLAFASAYFLSAMLRAITATLAPVFSTELALSAGDLGLLAGAYFLGFSALQLPMGVWLDRGGPRRTLLRLLVVAAAGCCAFAWAASLAPLIAARFLIGVGVAGCLMAPLTAYRRLFTPAMQLRANAWMLMTGSLGMLASTLPVQALLPVLGWRGLFWCFALMLLASAAAIHFWVPRDPQRSPLAKAAAPEAGKATQAATGSAGSAYREVWRHPLIQRLLPLAVFNYGGMIAVQSLWAGPWLTQVGGRSPQEAAQGLFTVNGGMLVAFAVWGALMPRLAKRGISPLKLIQWGTPISLALLTWIVWLGPQAGAWHWTAWCIASSVVTLSQPAIGAAFPANLAGRALSGFNLGIFLGVFVVQWGVGGLIDFMRSQGQSTVQAYQWAFGVFGVACALAYLFCLFFRKP